MECDVNVKSACEIFQPVTSHFFLHLATDGMQLFIDLLTKILHLEYMLW